MVYAKPSWYVGCSPRDPRKLLPELGLLLEEYDGKEWTAKEQALFAESLAGLESFEGEGYTKELAFSTRDRVAKMKSYGLVYVVEEKGKKILHITEAGKAILNSPIPEEIFLKQMLKWQYPSYQHKNPNQYPAKTFSIRPFIFTLKLIIALDGMTKTELAIFAFTTTDENKAGLIIEEIRHYRKKRDGIFGKTKKLEFDDGYHLRKFTEAYSEYLHVESDEDFLDKKLRNSYDMADALIRHLRFTPLFTIRGSRVVLSENMKELADWIVSQPITINKDYSDANKFYKYMGNPNLPLTILDDKPILTKTLQKVHTQIIDLSKKIPPTTKFKISPFPKTESMSILQLKELLFKLLNEKKEVLHLHLEKDIQKEPAREEIIEMFDRIVEHDVIDPSTYLEWNMWRALLHVDDEEQIVPNFKMDADLQPTNGAGGKMGDVEAYYADFNLLAEVTLTFGQRQADKEIEPVWRHVGNFQANGNGKKTIGLFVAPKIDPATPRDFFVKTINPYFDGATTTIIPLTLDQFIDIFNFIHNIKKNKSKKMLYLWTLFEQEATSGKHKHGISWWQSFPEVIARWKKELIA